MTPSFDAYSPAQMRERVVAAAEAKNASGARTLLVLGVLAGAFIALGAQFSAVALTGLGEVGWGLQRLVAGGTFALGLMLVVVAGAELFTGDNLVAMAWAEGKVTTARMLRIWGVVLAGNVLGSVGLAALVAWSDPAAPVVATLVGMAQAKAGLAFGVAFARGILCNVLVCLGVWMVFSCRGTGEKILAVLWPVTAFVACGFEHSVANVYLFAAAGLLGDLDPAGAVRNLVAVLLGNVVGGVGLVALVYQWAYGARR